MIQGPNPSTTLSCGMLSPTKPSQYCHVTFFGRFDLDPMLLRPEQEDIKGTNPMT